MTGANRSSTLVPSDQGWGESLHPLRRIAPHLAAIESVESMDFPMESHIRTFSQSARLFGTPHARNLFAPGFGPRRPVRHCRACRDAIATLRPSSVECLVVAYEEERVRS